MEIGGVCRARECEPITEVWGQSPQRGQAPEAENLLAFRPKAGQKFAPFQGFHSYFLYISCYVKFSSDT